MTERIIGEFEITQSKGSEKKTFTFCGNLTDWLNRNNAIGFGVPWVWMAKGWRTEIKQLKNGTIKMEPDAFGIKKT